MDGMIVLKQLKMEGITDMQKLEEISYDTERISDCLNCTKPECTNCKAKSMEVGGKKPSKMYKWGGGFYSLRELSELRGMSISGLRHRIRMGGVEFAMSDYRKKEQFDKKREPEK